MNFVGVNRINASRLQGRVCVVVHGWPKLSMTFVAQELVGLEEEGVDLLIATFGEPDKIRHSIHDRLKADILRLPALGRGLGQFFRAWSKVRKRPGFPEALRLFRSELKKGGRKRQWRAFLRGMMLAQKMPPDIRAIYVHFIGAPATVARYASLISGLPLTGSAHARDIWTGSKADIRAKLGAMDWCATCTTVGADYLKSLTDDPEKVRLIYHGLSFDRVPAEPPRHGDADGSSPSSPVELLSVGRAVEKKGFDVLLQALAALPKELHWRWTHVGDGVIMSDLQREAGQLGLADRIDWLGAQDQTAVFDLYRQSDLFVLPCRAASDGDQDGMPNVLMEAQSQGLACLSTNFSEIPELIRCGDTGKLVPPGDVDALAAELERLIRSPAERKRLGLGGHERVRRCFDASSGIGEIAGLLRKTMQDCVSEQARSEAA